MRVERCTANVRVIGDACPLPSLDLRRSVRAELADLIVLRSEALEPADRELVLAIYHRGHSVAAVGRLLGLQGNLRALRHRLHLLARRILSQEFAYVLAHRDRWPALRRRIATRYFLHGLSMRRIARECGLSFYAVRMHRLVILELMRSVQEVRP